MEFKWLFSFALLGSLTCIASAETVIKVLHIQKLPKVLEIWKEAAQEFEKIHPGVKVQFDYLENEAFKAKLPTLLRSKDGPSVFHSWGGGVMYEQINAGVCQGITKAIEESGLKDTFYPAGIQNFTYESKFYPAMLMMRILGREGMLAAYDGKNGGYNDPEVVKAFQLYKDLTALQPLQKGYLENTYPEAAGTFHDGRTAFHLMGTWDLTWGRSNAMDQKGLPDEKLGWFFFPEVKGGKGHANDIFASLNGWLVAKDAPKETVDFMKVWLGREIQSKLAKEGLFIPMVKGTADAIQNEFFKEIAQEVEKSQWIAIAMDQLLGPDTGRVFNDVEREGGSGKHDARTSCKDYRRFMDRE